MPEYRNDSGVSRQAFGLSGEATTVANGATIKTYIFPGDGFTLISEEPVKIKNQRTFLNPVNNGLTTGSWQRIEIPKHINAKSVLIQVHNGSASDFISFQSNPPGFHFSSTGGSGKDFINCSGSFSIDLFEDNIEYIGYVRATSGYYVVVTVLA